MIIKILSMLLVVCTATRKPWESWVAFVRRTRVPHTIIPHPEMARDVDRRFDSVKFTTPWFSSVSLVLARLGAICSRFGTGSLSSALSLSPLVQVARTDEPPAGGLLDRLRGGTEITYFPTILTLINIHRPRHSILREIRLTHHMSIIHRRKWFSYFTPNTWLSVKYS